MLVKNVSQRKIMRERRTIARASTEFDLSPIWTLVSDVRAVPHACRPLLLCRTLTCHPQINPDHHMRLQDSVHRVNFLQF